MSCWEFMSAEKEKWMASGLEKRRRTEGGAVAIIWEDTREEAVAWAVE